MLRGLELEQHFRDLVSILTRPEDRVLRLPVCALRAAYPLCFNPHPARRPGAPICHNLLMIIERSFNPHPARRPGAPRQMPGPDRGVVVSILTRPEGRVRQAGPHVLPVDLAVSILTRPEGRVRPVAVCSLSITESAFQSSPDPKAGCASSGGAYCYLKLLFQSSPDPKAGCAAARHRVHRAFYRVSILTRPEGRVRRRSRMPLRRAREVFQSSPDPKAGCAIVWPSWCGVSMLFQSSPDPKAGCALSPGLSPC